MNKNPDNASTRPNDSPLHSFLLKTLDDDLSAYIKNKLKGGSMG